PNLGLLLPGCHLASARVQARKGHACGIGARWQVTRNHGARDAHPCLSRKEGGSVLLRHATPARNLNSILRAGLLCAKSQGKLPVVWLCAPCKSSWVLLHTIKRHGGRAESTVLLEVSVSRRWLRR